MRKLTAIEFCRDAAARFQLLADIEPWPQLRRQYRELAVQYRARAAALKSDQFDEEGAAQHAA